MGQMEMKCISNNGKKILYWRRLLRWAMWPMGLLFSRWEETNRLGGKVPYTHHKVSPAPANILMYTSCISLKFLTLIRGSGIIFNDCLTDFERFFWSKLCFMIRNKLCELFFYIDSLYNILKMCIHTKVNQYFLLFSSPELKAQVSYSDRQLFVVHLSCRPSVCKLFHFWLLLQNHWANYNKTWHKSFLGGGDSKLFKWRGLPFSKGR
jgi:hypothetical protein